MARSLKALWLRLRTPAKTPPAPATYRDDRAALLHRIESLEEELRAAAQPRRGGRKLAMITAVSAALLIGVVAGRWPRLPFVARVPLVLKGGAARLVAQQPRAIALHPTLSPPSGVRTDPACDPKAYRAQAYSPNNDYVLCPPHRYPAVRDPAEPLEVYWGVGTPRIQLAKSTVQEVVDEFGDDCWTRLRGDQIAELRYDMDASGRYESRPCNWARPDFKFSNGLVSEIDAGPSQGGVVIHGLTVDSTAQQVFAAFGPDYVRSGRLSGSDLENVEYGELGLEFTMYSGNGELTSFAVRSPWFVARAAPSGTP